MRPGVIVLITLLGVAGVSWLALRARRNARRARLRQTPLAPDIKTKLARDFPTYAKLPDDVRARLDGLINQFLDEVRILGAEDIEVTDAMRALIAAQACVLIVNRPEVWYDHLSTIYVYPSGYVAKQVSQDGLIVSERRSHRLGESWFRGPLVLSWRDTADGAADDRDGRNVVYHEFAHRLDGRSGAMDGAPLMGDGARAREWARAMQPRFARHQAEVEAGAATFLDPYGATSPAEFFAVAVEAFIERADDFRREDPELYKLFERQLQLSPHEWG